MATQFAIVGSGIAGLAAAEAIRDRLPGAAISMISEEPHDFYSRPGLAYLLRGDVPEKQLYIRNAQELRALDMRRIHARVEHIMCDQHELILPNRKRLRYDRLLVATGATAVAPPFPGADLAGVVKLDSLDDVRKILKLAVRGNTAVVVGGGITALELAEGLHARGMNVEYLLRGQRYWSDVLDEEESRIVMNRLQHDGIVVHTQTEVKEARGRDGRLTSVLTKAGDRIRCQVLAVAIGVRPRTDLARDAGLKIAKGIVVNPFLHTTATDVFAAGDVAEVHDPHSGTSALDVLWPTALTQGRVAGANMAGERCAYRKAVACNVTQLAGLKVTIIGAVGGSAKNEDLVTITRGESESWRLLPRASVLSGRDDDNRIRLLVGERHILGALIMGDQSWSRPLERLVAAQADITPIRPALLADPATGLSRLAVYYQKWERTQLH